MPIIIQIRKSKSLRSYIAVTTEEEQNSVPDRPLECSECQRSIDVIYTEIVGKQISRTGMCQDCPALTRRLKGYESSESGETSEATTGLCCGACGTNLEAIRTGHPLGCSHCYEVFGDVLVMELLSAQRKGSGEKTGGSGRSMPLHIGRSPGEKAEINPSVRLIALNEALHDTLRKEDYEQAAWLRDQIKAITEDEDGASETNE